MVQAGKKGMPTPRLWRSPDLWERGNATGTPKQVGVVSVPGMLPIIHRIECGGSLANPEA
jgi:hypothetical protein